MIFWAKVVYVATFLLLLSLPFNPLLNRRFVVFPLCIVCVTLALISMYYATFRRPSGQSGRQGGRS